MKRVLALSVVVAMTGVACAVPPAADSSQALAGLRETEARYLAAVTSKDIEAFMTFYAANAVMYPPNAPSAIGTDAIRAFATELFGMAGLTVTASSSQVEVGAGGDLGYSHGIVAASMSGPDGTPMAESGPDVHVWKKHDDGTWKIVLDVWNSHDPLPTPSPMTGGAGS